MTELTQNDIAMYRDMYKDANGCRPSSHPDTLEEFNREIDYLARKIEEDMLQEKIWEQKCWEEFQRRVNEVIDSGAPDYTTAVRWLMDAENVDGDRGYFLFLNGLDSSRREEVFR